MSGAIPPLPQYAFTAWCLVKAQGQLYLLPFIGITKPEAVSVSKLGANQSCTGCHLGD
jgi:hypothetical protein